MAELISIAELGAGIGESLCADRWRLRRRLRDVEQAQRRGRPIDERLARLAAEVEKSVAIRQARRANVPHVRYDDQLPVAARRAEIVAALRDHQVVIVCGDTGSGKSTQLPKICLETGRGIEGIIGHTQPRRIAARSVAARIAEELASPLGHDVGYKVRFTDATNPRTYIKLMTDGVLLAESHRDRYLNQYDTIILDEAHERSLNIDFLLGYLKRLLPSRPDLKVIVTSATIDAERFARHFESAVGDVPVIMVSGRTYPVEVRYRPPVAEKEGEEPDIEHAVLAAVDELARERDGDLLIFMPTEQEILATAKALRNHRLPGDRPGHETEVLPLYARLSTAEQNRIFQPHQRRRIVIATNVAESSLTVPGISAVIDTGTARISRYAARSKVQRLPIEPVSQASADQRKGRCGRLGPGVCIRLFSEDDFLRRERYTPAEILRSNLAAVALQAKALRLGNIQDFPFLDAPRPESVRDAYRTLFELGAVDDRQELTELGRQLSRLPVDPRIGRIILAGVHENCLHEILIIAAALELQDPRERPSDQEEAADQAHARFNDEQSDFISFLKLWDFYHELKGDLSRNQLRRACRGYFLSHNRMREWQDVHRQLLKLSAQAGFSVRPRRNDHERIHRALLAGFLSSIAFRGDQNDYRVAGGQKALLWPGSAAYQRRPKWVMAGEVLETSRLYLRTVARINPRWIEPLAEHLVKRSYRDPHWDPTVGAAMVVESVSLFGLPVVRQRRVRLAAVDPVHAREMFIEHALVCGGYATRARFLAHNRQLLEDLERLQRKVRRYGLLRGEHARFGFYDRRLPAEVVDAASFERWRRDAEREQPGLLFMTPRNLLTDTDVTQDTEAFPDAIGIGPMRLPLDYCFEPGTEHDGITVTVPKEGFHQLDARRLEWLVPGLVEEKVAALIKSLPKTVRRGLVPVPDTARQALGELRYPNGCLSTALAQSLTRIAGATISPEAFRIAQVPDHLRMRIRVVDSAGRAVAVGRDLASVRKQLWAGSQPAWGAIDDERYNRQGITSWDFGDLPERVELSRGGMALSGYPALVDAGASVSLQMATTAEAAAHQTRGGVRRLVVLAAAGEIEPHVAWLPGLNDLVALGSELGDRAFWQQRLIELVADRAFLAGRPLPRSQSAFAECLASGRERIGLAVQDAAPLVMLILEGYSAVRRSLQQATNPQCLYATADIEGQLRELFRPDFLLATAWQQLQCYPRYLRAIQLRLDRIISGGAARDRQLYDEIDARWPAYLDLAAQYEREGIFDAMLGQYRWLIEEFRVSLFAQQLGTLTPVSPKRLDQLWAKLSFLQRPDRRQGIIINRFAAP
ncbi:MAG TPA: ATP-dependent RNA helicase HrpA [Pirellulales bacterium]|nr:ATP-dependent RNA helicase HrpA [Pirellulales bacterium]